MKVIDLPLLLESYFKAYILPTLECWAPVLMSFSESQLGLLKSAVRSEEMLCEGEHCCLRHGRKISTLCFLY